MLLPPPIAFLRKRTHSNPKTAAPVAPLELTAAFYDWDELILILTFDRAVEMAGLVGSAIVVNDQQHNDARFAATGAAQQLSGEILQIGLELLGDASGIGVHLDASVGNGIVAVDDGAAWVGVSDLELPFGS